MAKLSSNNITEDPNVVIVSRGQTFTAYKDTQSNEAWVIFGDCNCCGQCETGSQNPNIVWIGEAGKPYAEYDVTFETRKDIPVRPEIKAKCPACQLWGVYL